MNSSSNRKPLPVKIRRCGAEFDVLQSYESISCSFEVRSLVDLRRLKRSAGAEIVEVVTDPWIKNYDDCLEDRPTSLPSRLRSLAVFLAQDESGQTLGGCILCADAVAFPYARDPGVVVVVDLRVQPAMRGQGIAAQLIDAACAWAKGFGFRLMRIETQDTNVPACRLYRRLGGRLHQIVEGAYRPHSEEAQVVWEMDLVQAPEACK
jgi:GNAT superfamily N-acetyltransferase